MHGQVDWNEVQRYTADKIPVNPKDFRSDFEEIFEQVKKKYPYITKKHINLDRFTPHAFNELTPCNRKWLIHYL